MRLVHWNMEMLSFVLIFSKFIQGRLSRIFHMGTGAVQVRFPSNLGDAGWFQGIFPCQKWRILSPSGDSGGQPKKIQRWLPLLKTSYVLTICGCIHSHIMNLTWRKIECLSGPMEKNVTCISDFERCAHSHVHSLWPFRPKTGVLLNINKGDMLLLGTKWNAIGWYVTGFGSPSEIWQHIVL